VWVQPQDHRIVGECLPAVRSSAGITQRDLAAKLGKPQSFVSAYENEQRRLDILELCEWHGSSGQIRNRLFPRSLRDPEADLDFRI